MTAFRPVTIFLLIGSGVGTLTALVLFLYVWPLSAGFLVLFLIASVIVDLAIVLRAEPPAN